MSKSLLDFLQQDNFVRWQLIIYIYFNRIYANVINMCWMAYTRASRPLAPVAARCEQLKSVGVGTDSSSRNNNETDWCLPPLPPFLKWYQSLSTSLMVYLVVINSFPVDSYVNLLFGPLSRPSHCYVPGRLIFYSTLPRAVPGFFAFAHLCWRLKMCQKFKRPQLDMVAFMLLGEQVVEREQDRLARQLKHGTRSGLSQFQLYLGNILYHTYKFRNRLHFCQRPNRTREARKALIRFTAQCSLAIAIIFFLGICILLPLIVSSIFRDLTYVDRYPACSPWLEEKAERGQLNWGSTTLMDPYKLSLNLFDILVNWILWFDTGASLFIVLTSTYLYNYDLLYYWRKLELQLAQLDHQLKFNWFMSGWSLKEEEEDKEEVSTTNQPQLKTLIRHPEAICKLQAQLVDFFSLLRKVDQQVSDIITASVIVWLFIFSVGTLYFLVYGSDSVAKEVRIIQVVSAISLAIENVFLLSLRRALHLSYGTVCSIMAFDHSQFKCRFTGILDYWSPEHGAGSYTFLGGYSFTSTTILSLVGWSISMAIVGDNFLRRKLA